MPFTKGHTLYNHPNSIKTRFQKGGAGHTIPHTEESKLLMGKNRQGKAVGKANASYTHGLTSLYRKMKSLPEYKLWQRKVLERDNFVCHNCLKKGGNLTPHHLTAFSFLINIVFKIKTLQEAKECFLLWNIRNGATLCEKCHSETPNYKWRVHKTPRDRTLYLPLTALAIFIFLLLPQPTFSATFGYTSAGASYWIYANENIQNNGSYTPASAGTVTNISFYTRKEPAGSNVTQQYALYLNSDDSLITNGNTDNVLINSETAQWWSGSFTINPSVSVVAYKIVFWQDRVDTTYDTYAYYDTGTIDSQYRSATAFSWPNPITWTTWTTFKYKFSIYATYTASAAAKGIGGEDIIWIESD